MDTSVPLIGKYRARRILVFYVGGTIGMQVNAHGALEPCKGYFTKEMQEMRELQGRHDVAPFDIIEYDRLIDSSDMSVSDYMRLAFDVRQHYEDYDGFLIAHGTDTMHYTASALSFLLYNLAKPVILTGAMVPLAAAYNDARRNIITSMMIASLQNICEVCIFFNDSLFRGNRCDKVYHTYDAFQSLNYPALGTMEAMQFVLKEQYLLPQPTGDMTILSNLKGRVITVWLGADPDVQTILALLCGKHAPPQEGGEPAAGAERPSPLLDAMVLVLRGVGSAEGNRANMLRRICTAAVVMGVVTVAVQGELSGSFSTMETQRLRGICPSLVYVGDMCPSTAVIKLMYLFGRGLFPAGVASMMPANLRGEVTPSTVHSNL